MNTHRVYHRGQRRAWSRFLRSKNRALLQAAARTGYSVQAEERLIARTCANPSKSTRGPQGQVQP